MLARFHPSNAIPNVFRAESGEAALQVLRAVARIEILLTDVLMPHMDGVTLAGRAKELSPNLKVILMSGYALPELHTAIQDRSDF